jgi:5-methylcytosine-specific restriction protein A
MPGLSASAGQPRRVRRLLRGRSCRAAELRHLATGTTAPRGCRLMRAPKICSEPGCLALVHDGGSRCPDDRSRIGKWRKGKIGTNRTGTAAHKARRERILKRDPWCMLKLPGCQSVSTVCDHIIPLAAGGADEDWNCQGVCQNCSDKKTSAEGHYLAGHDVPCPWAGAPTTAPRRTPTPAPRRIG